MDEAQEKDVYVRGEVRISVKMLNALFLYVSGLTQGAVLSNANHTHSFNWIDFWPIGVAGGLYAMGKVFIDNSALKKRRV